MQQSSLSQSLFNEGLTLRTITATLKVVHVQCDLNLDTLNTLEC